MIFTRALLHALLAGLAIAAPSISKRKVAFNWGSDKLRGVNIGGWLVLEPWITPSIFDKLGRNDIVDEFTLGQKLGQDAALTILREHWNSWVTWEDFNKIKQSGFNLVRIPIGYWAYDTFDSPYVSGAAVYIDAAIDWARSLGLKIIIDLHGAPGSQNGFDNSGEKTANPAWQTGNTVSQTLQVLKTISAKYAQPSYQDVIIGIQLLNEPLIGRVDLGVLKQFYRDGFGQVRDTSDTTVVLHDGFNTPSSWNNFLTPSDNNAQNVAIDHHEYQIFSPGEVAMSPAQHAQTVCARIPNYNGADKWTFVGEWTGAMTDCAKYLNGFGVGARYDGTFNGAGGSSYVGSCAFANDLSKWTQAQKDQTRTYIETQMSAFEAKTQGWVWWNFKTESAPEWDAFKLIDAGIFPQPFSDRKSSLIC
ncbi:glycoside hydrolase family 5 protein [Lophiostoma macrostomum CBS 122681]|uniref:glucan 1,3-beta-glucosidase n=1 Tax=Lophiostoma macrostomum CBS 122681 TaxID=1314788 RepID=A0A6A6TAC5_9PLEO|nr:glycoside hydrolase family 5 protein [Lophiostoma macrostomum CBS 122681]